ncbi:MAG TPA: hypothetical protein VLG72_01755, partial [Nitrospirota bacterium]|nr:hypothetical protein [Nitrospirota bacterium]
MSISVISFLADWTNRTGPYLPSFASAVSSFASRSVNLRPSACGHSLLPVSADGGSFATEFLKAADAFSAL